MNKIKFYGLKIILILVLIVLFVVKSILSPIYYVIEFVGYVRIYEFKYAVKFWLDSVKRWYVISEIIEIYNDIHQELCNEFNIKNESK